MSRGIALYCVKLKEIKAHSELQYVHIYLETGEEAMAPLASKALDIQK